MILGARVCDIDGVLRWLLLRLVLLLWCHIRLSWRLALLNRHRCGCLFLYRPFYLYRFTLRLLLVI